MINSRNMDDLHPTLKRGALELIKRCKSQGLDITITQTLRDVEYQNFLYAKGRTSEGKIVTNARGGSSYHNYGLAFDICKKAKGHEYDDLKFFESVGKVWESMGGTWGGNFKNIPDKPHFEFSGGMKLENLKNGAKLSNDTKMIWEKITK